MGNILILWKIDTKYDGKQNQRAIDISVCIVEILEQNINEGLKYIRFVMYRFKVVVRFLMEVFMLMLRHHPRNLGFKFHLNRVNRLDTRRD